MTEVVETPTTSGPEVTGIRDSVPERVRLYNHQCPPSALVMLALVPRPDREFQGCKEVEAKAFGLDIIPLVHSPACSNSLHVIVV